MPIDPNLLTKAAKVYEAAEAVDGMKPKEVFESHKKCAPGEFGMNKEGFGSVKSAAEPTWGQFGHEFAQNFNPWNGRPAGTGTAAYMDKWYNPLSQNRDPISKGEGPLRRAGQAAVTTAATAVPAALGTLALSTGGGVVAPALFAQAAGANYLTRDEFRNIRDKNPSAGRPAPAQRIPRPVPRPITGMNKSGAVGLTGALLGALGGAATADRGRVNESAGRGAVIGAGTELGALAGLVPGGALGGALGYGLGGASGAGLGALAGGGLGALGGGVLGNSAAHGLVGPYKKDNKDNKDKKDEKDMKKESAYAFGMRFKQAFKLTPEMGYGAAGGGLLGAGLGGLAGFMNPGEEEDEYGRVRQRSRFGAALRGALGGGAAGALGGGALGHFSPGTVNNLQQMLFGASKAQAPSPARAHQLVPLPGGKQVMALPGVKTPEALAAEREQYMAERAKKNKPVAPADEIQLVPPAGL